MKYEWRQSNTQEYLYVEADNHYDLGFGTGKGMCKNILFMKAALDKRYVQIPTDIFDDRATPDELTERFVSFIPENYMEEIKGMYDGVKSETIEDISFNDILRQSVFINVLYQALSRLPITFTFEGCTDFGVVNPDGSVTHGQNYDSDANTAKANAFVHHKLKGAPEAFIYRTGADLGTACGINENGVCLTVSVVNSNFPAPIMIPRGVLIREAMKTDNAKDMQQAMTDEKGQSPFAYNLVFSDKKRVVATQSTPLETRVFDVKRILVQSNQYDYVDWFKYMKNPYYSRKRQLYAEQLIESIYARHGGVSNDDLLEILRDEPIICRKTPTSETTLFLTRESFGYGMPKGKIGRIPF